MEYKDYRILGDGTFGMYVIKQMGSGAVPQELRGSYTTPRRAQDAIDGYKPKRGVRKDAETDTTADV